MQPNEYIERLKTLTETKTLYAVADLMGVSWQAVQRYSLNRAAMDNFACIRTAELLDYPLERVIADMELFREKNPERRAVWKDLLGKWAACVLFGTGLTIGHSGEATAGGLSPSSTPPEMNQQPNNTLYYVK